MFSFIADWNPLLAVVALLVGFVFLVKGLSKAFAVTKITTIYTL